MRSARSPPCLARSSRIRPNAAWVACSSPVGAGIAGMAIRPKSRLRLSRRMRVASISASTPARALPPIPASGVHSSPSAMPERVAHGVGLGRVHQAGMIVLVAGEGQAEALDRPGDEQGRDIVHRRVERLDQRLHAMAAEVAHQRAERFVVEALEEGRALFAEVGIDPRPPRGAALVEQGRGVGVGKIVEPVADRGMLGQRGGQLLAVAKLDRPPAATGENLVEPLEHAVGRGRVEALAVIVDDPPAIADVMLVAPRSGIRRYCPRRARHRRSARRTARDPPRPVCRGR